MLRSIVSDQLLILDGAPAKDLAFTAHRVTLILASVDLTNLLVFELTLNLDRCLHMSHYLLTNFLTFLRFVILVFLH